MSKEVKNIRPGGNKWVNELSATPITIIKTHSEHTCIETKLNLSGLLWPGKAYPQEGKKGTF